MLFYSGQMGEGMRNGAIHIRRAGGALLGRNGGGVVNRFARLAHFCGELFFPRRCPFCDAVLGFSGPCGACAEVEASLKRPAGEPLADPWGDRPHLAKVYAVYAYDREARAAILRMKFHDRPDLAVPLAERQAALLRAASVPDEVDAVCFVPPSPKELRGRGWSVPRLLARELGYALDRPVLRALVKIRETRRQMTLSGRERRRNLKGAFSVDPAVDVRGKTLLLVDDVVTTGSTLEACAQTLLRAGAAACIGICVAAAAEDAAPALQGGAMPVR